MFLIDTNVVSELTRKRPNPGVVAWARDVRSAALSVVTIEEIWFGLTRQPNDRVRSWFERYLVSSVRSLPVTAEISRAAGILRGQQAAQGQARSQADMLIAATAAAHGLTLVTRNVRDFGGCGVAVLDPFRG